MRNSEVFDYSGFIDNQHFLESLAIEEDCGKYHISIKSYDFIYFDRVLTNGRHSHDFFEMCLVLKGRGDYFHDGKRYGLKAGDLFIAEPGKSHEISSLRTKDLYLVFLFFGIKTADIPLTTKNEDILISNFLKSHEVLSSNASLLFHYLPLLLIDDNGNYKKRNLNKAITTKAWIFDCLTELSSFSSYSHETEKSNVNVEMATSYIQKNLKERLTIGEIASHACVSERHLRYLFQKHLNMTVTHFIQKEKIVMAENKLRRGVKIHEAAELVGINNASQFSKLFRKINGITPKVYSDLFSQLK